MTKRVEINYVVETETAINIMQEEQQVEAHDIRLINKQAFQNKCREWFEFDSFKSSQLWNNLLGNYPETGESGRHPQVHYLTEDSCEVILKHIHQFKQSGLDYQNLPNGFFMVRNPLEGSGRDVLHYSDFLANNSTVQNPLALTLTDKENCQVKLKTHLKFDHPKQAWYQFLVDQANQGTGTTPCTQKQLDEAFIHFANKIEACGLAFFEPNFGELTCLNPIVLLGRWNTVMFNRHLKDEDRAAQWQVLPELPLQQSYGCIRGITDHMHSKTPCGFLLPEMKLNSATNSIGIEYVGYQSVDSDKRIKDKMTFWRYVAYRQNRNSIEFYRQAIQFFPKDVSNEKLLSMLAAATTGANHLANTPEEEAKELETWQGVCKLIDTIEESSVAIKALMSLSGNKGMLQRDFLYHLTRLQMQPNIPFLSVMAKHIRNFITGLGAGALAQIATGNSPLEPLVDLSDKLNACVRGQGTLFYQGCRFYLVDGKWTSMSTKSYTELAFNIHRSVDGVLANVMVPLISTFSITKADQLDTVAKLLHLRYRRGTELTKKLTFFSTVFREVEKPLKFDQLMQILTELKEDRYSAFKPLDMLSYFEQHFAEYFKAGYFDKKRQVLEDAADGLNEHQISLLDGYQFDQQDLALIIQIESALVRKNPLIADDQLIQFNDQFRTLTDILMPSELTEFLQRLAAIRNTIPDNTHELTDLINQVIKRKSLTAFNVIFLRNKIEKVDDESLLSKINKYIELESHITSKNWAVNPIYLQETLSTLILKLPKDMVNETGVAADLTRIIDRINEIASLHPHAQQHTINLINNLVNGEENYFTTLRTLLAHLTELAAVLPPGKDKRHRDNMSVFYALASHYQTKPQGLISLLGTLKGLDASEQRFFLIFITRLLNSEQSVENFDELVELCRSDKEKMALLQTHCDIPPYATIDQLYEWLDSGNFVEEHKRFCLSPFAQRHPEYMFNRSHYNRQRKEFEGVDKALFTDELGDELDKRLRENRCKDMTALTRTIDELKSKSPLDQSDLTVLLTTAIEVLARTAHQHDASSPTGKCSQELNTTQVMAAYAMLQKGEKFDRIINQVDTGEGKSRLMMVLSACQAIRGKTDDFMTSNMVLAERDYFTYQEFFNALNIATGLINLNTPPQLYRKGGVNFTDNSNLILLRNKSDMDLSPYDYLDEDEDNRCLMLDEEDKFIHDKSSHAFNFAAKSKKLSGFVWVYPLLVNFMREQREKLEEFKGEDELVDAFLNYVPLHDNDQLHQASLANMKVKNPKQLKVWLKSAMTALTLTKNVDYAITSDEEDKLVPVRNVDGLTCYTRQVLVLDNGRPMEGSNYSDGVHQCLCAIENQNAGKEAFVILPENETQRTIYTHPFLNVYHKILGVSGSTRAEAPMSNPEINLDNWQYMITPREKRLRRQEKRVQAGKDANQQLAFIKRDIIEACQSGKSYLLVCRSDKQSKAILDELQKDGKLQQMVKQWQHVHGLTSTADEKSAVEQAGIAGFVTISSVGMFSRGVDIRADNLSVRAAFVPTLEDEIQIKGRTGRFGKDGDYRMIINLQDAETPIDGNTYNIEARVTAAQHKMALSASVEEKTASMYAEFLEKVHQAFLKHFQETKPSDRPNMLQKWQQFLDAMQKDWELKRTEIKEALDNQDIEKFKSKFGDFITLWRKQMREDVASEVAIPMSPKLAEQCFKSVQAHRGFFSEQQAKSKMIKTKWSYDKADDGQATIYQMPFAQTIATLTGQRPLFANTRAWWEGRGQLFPDLRATLNGERPLFANLRAFISYLWQLLTNCFKGNDETQVSTSPAVQQA